jgi:hypothetical protein
MKKQAKKLVLAKETLRTLEKRKIREAIGGSAYSCDPSCLNKCPQLPTPKCGYA